MPDALVLDLEALSEFHTELDEVTVSALSGRASAALERGGHSSPCSMRLANGDLAHDGVVAWRPPGERLLRQTDAKRVTEEGAEGVALAFVGLARHWVVERRLQQGEFGDWLLLDPSGQRVALEVSGIADGYEGGRLTTKLRQVERAVAPIRAACVVAFGPPVAVLDLVGRA